MNDLTPLTIKYSDLKENLAQKFCDDRRIYQNICRNFGYYLIMKFIDIVYFKCYNLITNGDFSPCFKDFFISIRRYNHA